MDCRLEHCFIDQSDRRLFDNLRSWLDFGRRYESTNSFQKKPFFILSLPVLIKNYTIFCVYCGIVIYISRSKYLLGTSKKEY